MDVFDDTTIREIGKISRLPAPQVAALAARLEEIGRHFRGIILAVPTNMRLGPQDLSASARQKWLHQEVKRPVDQLLASMEQRDRLAAWPDRISSELNDEDWSHLRALLGRLRQFTEELCDDLQARAADSSTINAELRFEIVSSLAEATREAGLTLSRHRHRGAGYKSPAAQVIQLACDTIGGGTVPIDRELRNYLKLHQEK